MIGRAKLRFRCVRADKSFGANYCVFLVVARVLIKVDVEWSRSVNIKLKRISTIVLVLLKTKHFSKLSCHNKNDQSPYITK